jgi:glutathione synthase/RimK-type ligase-like ATP-grasp enzyme
VSGPYVSRIHSARSFDLSQVAAAWYRKPQPPRIAKDFRPEVGEFIREEASAARDAVFQLLRDVWWNNPYQLRQYSQKPIQLEIARHLGLRTPRTLLTNCASDAFCFAQSCRAGLIVKTLSGVSGALDGEQYTCFSHLLRSHEFDRVSNGIQTTPVILQEFIPKRRDIRVNIIDDILYAAAIESQDLPETTTDWRTVTPDRLCHRRYSLPEQVGAKLLAFQRVVGLPFGAVDLVEGEDGDLWFLENNLNGQWFWIEQLTGFPISQAIANSLCDFSTREHRSYRSVTLQTLVGNVRKGAA